MTELAQWDRFSGNIQGILFKLCLIIKLFWPLQVQENVHQQIIEVSHMQLSREDILDIRISTFLVESFLSKYWHTIWSFASQNIYLRNLSQIRQSMNFLSSFQRTVCNLKFLGLIVFFVTKEQMMSLHYIILEDTNLAEKFNEISNTQSDRKKP